MRRGKLDLILSVIVLFVLPVLLHSQMVELPYDYPSKKYFEANDYFEQLSIRKSEAEIIDIIKTYPDNPARDEVTILFGNIEFLTGDYKNADAKLSEFIEKRTNSPLKAHAGLLRAYIQFEEQNYHLASELFSDSKRISELEFQIRGDSVYRVFAQNALFWGGIALCQVGKYQEAKPLLEECFRTYPDLNYADDALYTLGVIEEVNHSFSIAINYYATIYKRYPYSNTYVASRIREINNKLILREPISAIDILTHTQNILAHIAVRDSIGLLYEKQDYVSATGGDLQYLSGEAQNIAGNYAQALIEFRTYIETYSNPELLDYVRLGAGWALLNLGQNKEALEFYDTVLDNHESENDRTKASAKLFRAVALKRKGDVQKAAKEFAALSIQPSYFYLGQALLELGQIYYEEGSFDDAKRTLERAKREATDNIILVRISLILGATYLELRSWQKAITEYNNAEQMALRSTDVFMPKKEWYLAEARLKMGVSLVLSHRNKEAIKVLNTFLGDNKKDKRIDEALFWLAEAYYRADLLKNSASTYELVLRNYPLSKRKEDVLYGLGWSYFRMKDFRKSSATFDKMIREFTSSKYTLEVLARQADGYYIIKDYRNAADLYKRAAEHSPRTDEGQYCAYQLCHALYRLGSYEKAITYLLSFVRTYPESKFSPYSLYLIGWIRFQQKNYKEAISNFEFLTKAYQNNDLVVRSYYAIGDAYYNMGDYEKAIEYYNVIVSSYPSNSLAPEAWRSLQFCYMALGREEEAMRIADSVITSHPNTAFAQELFMKKADMFFSGARYNDAISEYQSFIKSYPDSKQGAEALYWMGKSYINIDEVERAVDVFDELMSKYPESEVAPLSMIEKAMLKKRQGEIPATDSLLLKIEEIYPVNSISAQAGFERAVLKYELGDTVSALSIYRTTADKYHGMEYADQARYRLASYYRSRSKNDSARKHFELIARSMTDFILSAESQFRVGEMWMRDTNWTKAAEAFNMVRERYPGVETWHPLSLLNLGECYEKLEMIDKALDVYKALFNQRPEDEYGKTVKLRIERLENSN